MGARSSKTRPAGQGETVVESFSPPDAVEDAASARSKSNRVTRGNSATRLVQEIWSNKATSNSRSASQRNSPGKRTELQMSSEEDTEDVQPEGSEEKKGEKKKRKKKKRRSQSVEVSPKKSPVKLNEVQVIKKPPADAVPEREKRFEQIKAAYHLRDQTSTNLHEIPAPSHTEAKAESLARFLKRNSKPAIPTGVIDIPTSTRFDESVARQPTSLSPSKSSKSSPKAQERTNKVIGFNNRHSSNEAKLVDIGASEREEAASHLMLQPRAAVTQIVSENSPSKAAEARSASLPTPQTLGQQPGKSQSSYRSLCIDDTDENIMDDILLDT